MRWENAAKELGGGQPLVFIVDELDRCRPDFALELLEKIKHLFSVPNVCFLVVTNLEQFKAVVQRTYGYSEEEARVYLDKFFHHIFRLPPSNENLTFSGEKYISHLRNVMSLPPISERTMGCIKEVVIYYKMSLRDIEQMLACVALTGSGTNDLQEEPGSFIIVALYILRKINPDVYGEILRGTASWNALPEHLQDQQGPMSYALSLTKRHLDEHERPLYAKILRAEYVASPYHRKKFLARIAAKIEQFSE